MDCSTIRPQLSAWHDRQLSQQETDAVRDHIAQCTACWHEAHALSVVGSRIGLLKEQEVPELPFPEALLMGIRTMPRWLVHVAVIRRWIPAGTSCALLLGCMLALLQWSGPLPATLAGATVASIDRLTPGTTLVARAGETVTLTVGDGTLTLHGPGAAVVRAASQGRMRRDQRLTVALNQGQLIAQFPRTAAPHDIQVMTPQAAIQLTGTWVSMRTTALATHVGVFEGQARVTSVAASQPRTLVAGQQAEIRAGWFQVAQIPSDEWLQWRGVAPKQQPIAEEHVTTNKSQPYRPQGVRYEAP